MLVTRAIFNTRSQLSLLEFHGSSRYTNCPRKHRRSTTNLKLDGRLCRRSCRYLAVKFHFHAFVPRSSVLLLFSVVFSSFTRILQSRASGRFRSRDDRRHSSHASTLTVDARARARAVPFATPRVLRYETRSLVSPYPSSGKVGFGREFRNVSLAQRERLRRATRYDRERVSGAARCNNARRTIAAMIETIADRRFAVHVTCRTTPSIVPNRYQLRIIVN